MSTMNADATAEKKRARTSRRTKWTQRRKCEKNTHEDQGGIQPSSYFLISRDLVVLIGFMRELVVELDAGGTECSEEVREERRQCFPRNLKCLERWN